MSSRQFSVEFFKHTSLSILLARAGTVLLRSVLSTAASDSESETPGSSLSLRLSASGRAQRRAAGRGIIAPGAGIQVITFTAVPQPGATL